MDHDNAEMPTVRRQLQALSIPLWIQANGAVFRPIYESVRDERSDPWYKDDTKGVAYTASEAFARGNLLVKRS